MLLVGALVASSCLYLPRALRAPSSLADPNPSWWCDGINDRSTCLLLSAQLDIGLRSAQDWPTVGDARAAGGTPVDVGSGRGFAYQRPGTDDTFAVDEPQLLLYAASGDDDRLAGVAYLTTSPTAPTEAPAGATPSWVSLGGDRWILPMWIVPGYEQQTDLTAPTHPCLAAGVALASTADACFVASHPEPLEVLVTNDDGIGAPGIDALVEGLRGVSGINLMVVAPAVNQSGSSDRVSPGPVDAAPGTTASGFGGTAVDGTPADSVLYALNELEAAPDLVISGINSGQNMGPIIELSGTVGAARIAARNGVPALATSQGLAVTPDFPTGVAATLAWLEDFRLGLAGEGEQTVANLNTPTCTDPAVVRGTIDTFVAVDLAGRSYTAQDCESTSTVINDDVDAFNQGFISITDAGLYEAPLAAGLVQLGLTDADECEVNGNECLLPFPSDAFTVADASTTTGLRVALPLSAMPTNAGGVPVDTSAHNQADGFGPGSAGLALLPGVDPATSGLPPITDIGASLLDTSASVVVDATTGERLAHWSEIDSQTADEDRQGLFVRPASNYTPSHRIVIALRDLVDGAGQPIEPTAAFVAYRDRVLTDDPAVEARRPAMERLFLDLALAGVARDDLVIAWDFTVISNDNLTGPLFGMAEDAFADLGDAAPTFSIDSVVDESTRRVINGTYDIPLYLTGDGSPGNGLNLVDDGLHPTRNGTWTAPFRCQIPFFEEATDPGPGVVYGHGLLGTGRQATSSGPTSLSRYNFVVCGTDLIGMAEEDVGNAVASLQDASNFRTLAERLMQGHLNEAFLARLLAHPDGFAADAAFLVDGESTIDADRTYFYGISQGGIMGPATTAISPDIDRAGFGVPGVNYSTLLNRSIDFDLYQTILDPAYPDKLDQAVVLLANQMLWDRGEGNGYVHLFADPLPGMNDKQGLLQVALGDHQVANIAAEVMARTMEAGAVWPAFAEDRTPDVEPFFDITRIETHPFVGSGISMWDSGSPLSPLTNTSNHTGVDPHGDPRNEPAAVEQLAHFFLNGEVIDTCNDQPCVAAPD